MDAEIYREQILDRYHHPRHQHPVEGATHRAEGANYSCGDELTLFAIIDDQKITELGYTSQACAVCTASTDLLCDQLIGQPPSSLKEITAAKIQENIGIPLSPVRLKCALLPLETARHLKPVS